LGWRKSGFDRRRFRFGAGLISDVARTALASDVTPIGRDGDACHYHRRSMRHRQMTLR
jgi:hypothetical protein